MKVRASILTQVDALVSANAIPLASRVRSTRAPATRVRRDSDHDVVSCHDGDGTVVMTITKVRTSYCIQVEAHGSANAQRVYMDSECYGIM